jgi:hypothetical protein
MDLSSGALLQRLPVLLGLRDMRADHLTFCGYLPAMAP